MARKKNSYLQLANPADLEQLKNTVRKRRRAIVKKWGITTAILIMILAGSFLLVKNRSYTGVKKAAAYTDETSDTNRYAQFSNGIVRYNRDGVVFLNKKNKEKWIHPSQMKNPVFDMNKDTFAVADSGGNSILVFTEEGMKGEIETTLPIEKMSVSGQGIISTILKNESSPMIVTYDSTGNILVEHQVTLNNTGYPLALDMSEDGMTLAVSYLSTNDGAVKSSVIYYNFGELGKGKTDYQVSKEEYNGLIIPEVYHMDENTSVAISDSSFILYEGKDVPKKKKEIEINQEIKSAFHTDKYIGFILLNTDKSGYEARLYNKSGKQVMNKAFVGEYRNVKMLGEEIIMFDGSKCCIIAKNGILRFKGDLKTNALEVIPTVGINRYLLMSANEMRVVYLTR